MPNKKGRAAKGNEPVEREGIKGVFSTTEIRRVGTGATQKKEKIRQFWMVDEVGDDRVEVQPINEKLIPVGKKRTITLDDLLDRFSPEPEFYVATSASMTQERWREIKEGKGTGGPPVDIEGFEISGSPEDMEKNARAGFGLGLTYLKRGNLPKAQEIFENLAELKADYKPEHKHMFNDFGISLRKEAMYDTALKHYFKAAGLVDNDENIFHNIARVYYEKKDYKNAVKYLEQSLRINPRLKESKLFLKFIRRTRRDSVEEVKLSF